MRKEELKSRVLGAASGLFLTIPQIWMVAAPLQLIAFIPVLYLASKKDTTYGKMIYAGVYMGIFYVLPQVYVLRMPLIITLILFAELILIFSIFSLLSYRLLHKPTLLSVFAVGALFVLLDWINFTAVPIWGMAQSIVRPWSAYPELISFVSLTGLTGIAFLIVSLQSLAVNAVVCPKKKRTYVAAAGVLLFAIALNIVLQRTEPVEKVKVSAMGWTEDSNSIDYPKDANSLYAKLVKKAAQEDSKIVVSPELGFYTGSGDISQWLVNFQKIAKENNIALVIGVASENSNIAVIIGPDGEVLDDYTKTHLTPFEDYKKGDGKPVIVTIDGKKTGVMICHDDNFTDISRKYGRKEVSLIAVPTQDWSQVKNAHFQSSINRAIESNYAVIRACNNGISAIISPKGELIKKMDHLIEGSGIITGEVALYSCETIFSLLGHWPIVPCLILLLFYTAGEVRPRISFVKHRHGLNL
ncbi:MAG: hypothetical protein JW787_10505 [Sedimentisphaerales bacterium]|nr:hypothetical protein [Sedimentisphaerales bacterium]